MPPTPGAEMISKRKVAWWKQGGMPSQPHSIANDLRRPARQGVAAACCTRDFNDGAVQLHYWVRRPRQPSFGVALAKGRCCLDRFSDRGERHIGPCCPRKRDPLIVLVGEATLKVRLNRHGPRPHVPGAIPVLGGQQVRDTFWIAAFVGGTFSAVNAYNA